MGFEEVDQRKGAAVFREQPDASPFRMQQSAAGFCNGLECLREIAAMKGFGLGQFPKRLLGLLQEDRCILYG
jgi:hypothetical protein